MFRFVITIATAAACIAGVGVANAEAQKTKKVYVYERISKGPRAQAESFVVDPQRIRAFPKDELYGVACVTPSKTAFSCPGGGM